MSFSGRDLLDRLEACMPADAEGLAVGLSGGIDSSALLLAVVLAPRRFRELKLRAIHVDHGLQPAAAGFRAACVALCAQLDVPLDIIALQITIRAGESVEAAARDARYRSLAARLQPGECLLTAHHSEDQAETLLLQALRGAGLKGLSAMPPRRRLGAGWHVRPVLDVPRGQLAKFHAGCLAEHPRLAGSVRDPMNEDPSFERVYLRRQVWPGIDARWPGAAAALSRSARHAAAAQALLSEFAALDLLRLRDGDALQLPALRALPEPRRTAAVRLWLDQAQVEPPSTARLSEALRQVLTAAHSRLPAIVWGSHALRRYRTRLFITPATPPRLEGCFAWQAQENAGVELRPCLGRLTWQRCLGGIDSARIAAPLSVRARRGGEKLKTAPTARTRSVQHLCQAAGILPWLRDALPLVFSGDALIAVADLWTNSTWCADSHAPGLAICWQGAPVLV